jgi:hypothetical protein
MDGLARKYGSYVSLIPIGSTFEGRAMRALKINTSPGRNSKYKIWVDSGELRQD